MSFLFHDPLIDLDTLEPADSDCDDSRATPPPEPSDWRCWLIVSDCDDREGA